MLFYCVTGVSRIQAGFHTEGGDGCLTFRFMLQTSINPFIPARLREPATDGKEPAWLFSRESMGPLYLILKQFLPRLHPPLRRIHNYFFRDINTAVVRTGCSGMRTASNPPVW